VEKKYILSGRAPRITNFLIWIMILKKATKPNLLNIKYGVVNLAIKFKMIKYIATF